jgi:hypothetical protein
VSDMIDPRLVEINHKLMQEVCNGKNKGTDVWFDTFNQLLEFMEAIKHDPHLELPAELAQWRSIQCSETAIRNMAAAEFDHSMGKRAIKAGGGVDGEQSRTMLSTS